MIQTVFLALGVLIINVVVYASGMHHYYFAISHLYYGVMLLAAIYGSSRNQKLLLGLTTGANWVSVLFFQKLLQIESIFIAFLYPVLAFLLLRTIRQLQMQRINRAREMDRINSIKISLEKQVRDLSTVFEVSQAANDALELEELFQRIIEILSERLGIYRGTLHIYENGEIVTSAEVVLGLTAAEQKRGTDHQIAEIEKEVLAKGEARGVPQHRLPRQFVELFSPEQVESKDSIAFWCLPVIVEEQVIGTLTIDKAKDELSASEDEQVLKIIASIIAQRVKIKQTIDALVQSERLAGLGKLVTTIAHEVRNPLGSIRLATQLLSEPASRFAPLSEAERAEIDEYTAIIIKEVDRLNRSIEQLLAFSKPAIANAEPCNIHELLDNCLATYQPELDRYNINVVREYTECPSVNINQDGITQVILNLFSNAMEAMGTQGTLTIQTGTEAEAVYIRVQDTGSGIPSNEVPHLFDAFYTTKQKGTGLGLYISQKILAEHEGSIEVDANLTTGTAFIITLPVAS